MPGTAVIPATLVGAKLTRDVEQTRAVVSSASLLAKQPLSRMSYIPKELIELFLAMNLANAWGEDLRRTEDESGFDDALCRNDGFVQVLGGETLRSSSRELVRA